jgi:hypothetical protein
MYCGKSGKEEVATSVKLLSRNLHGTAEEHHEILRQEQEHRPRFEEHTSQKELTGFTI